MVRFIGVLLMVSTLSANLWAQISGFEQTFTIGTSFDQGMAVQPAPDGGYVIAATSLNTTSGKSKMALIKTDARGILQWKKVYGDDLISYGINDMVRTADGYLVVGDFINFMTHKISAALLKFDFNGDTLWTKFIGDEATQRHCIEILKISEEQYVIAGFSWVRTGRIDLLSVKIDENGNVIWQKNYTISGYDIGTSVCETSDGGFIFTGETAIDPQIDNLNTFLLRTTALGDSVWSMVSDYPEYDIGSSVQRTPDSGYIVAGQKESGSHSSIDLNLIKTDSIGRVEWEKSFGGSYIDGASSVRVLADGGYIIAGQTFSFGNRDSDVYLIRTDQNGNDIWQKTFGGADSDAAIDLYITPDGGYIMTGFFGQVGNSEGFVQSQVYLIKTDREGFVTSAEVSEANFIESILLKQNYPNPFNPQTIIDYSIPRSVHVRITIYNQVGQQIRTLLSEYKATGEYSIIWDGRDDGNQPVPSGVYFYKLTTDGRLADSKKMLLVK